MRSVIFAMLIAVMLPVNAQPGPPVENVEVVNEESNAVPVMPVGRQPYQTNFLVGSVPGDIEQCHLLPIPEGQMLTVTTVGIRVQSDGAALPETYVRVVRQGQLGFVALRYLDDLQQIDSFEWSGTYNPGVFGGEVTNSEFEEISYDLAICVEAPDAPATFNRAEGVVSGYLTEGGIVDGAFVAPQ